MSSGNLDGMSITCLCGISAVCQEVSKRNLMEKPYAFELLTFGTTAPAFLSFCHFVYDQTQAILLPSDRRRRGHESSPAADVLKVSLSLQVLLELHNAHQALHFFQAIRGAIVQGSLVQLAQQVVNGTSEHGCAA